MRQLINYNRLLDEKIKKFRRRLATSKLKPRRQFVIPETDSTNFHAKLVKLEDKVKRNKLEKAKLMLKILAASIMSITFLLMAYKMRRILMVLMKTYDLKKVLKQKRKKKTKKRNSKITVNFSSL